MSERDLTIPEFDRLSCDERASGPALPSVSQAKAAGAVEAFFPDLIPRIYRFALRLTNHDAHAAEDITQDAFIRAWKHRRRLRNSDAETVRVFLFRTAHNLSRDRARKAARRRRFEDSNHLQRAGFSGEAADSHSLASDEHARIERAMAALPARQRDVLHLAACEGLPPQAIAEVLGITPQAVRSSLSLARKEIRAILNSEPE